MRLYRYPVTEFSDGQNAVGHMRCVSSLRDSQAEADKCFFFLSFFCRVSQVHLKCEPPKGPAGGRLQVPPDLRSEGTHARPFLLKLVGSQQELRLSAPTGLSVKHSTLSF